MSVPKKLRSVPSSPATGRRPADGPKPDLLTGIQPTPAVSHALRAVIRDHSYTKPRERMADHPSRLGLLLWTVVIAALLFVGYAATLWQGKQVERATYPLNR